MSEIQHVELVSANGDSRVVVSTWGGRVIEWKYRGRDVLFRSELLHIDERSAPHGGIPVLFPQFGTFGDGDMHGFVRNMNWRIESIGKQSCVVSVSSEECHDHYAKEFEFVLRLKVEVQSDQLEIELNVYNASRSESMVFTTGLHTYLAVSDVSEANLSGLHECRYLDASRALIEIQDCNKAIRFGTLVDRVYLMTPKQLDLADACTLITITQGGFEDTVIWNPGSELGPRFNALSSREWRDFVCIEAAQIELPVQLAPGDSWSARQSIFVPNNL